MKPTATCTVCEKPYYAAPNRIKAGAKFCSMACRSVAFAGSGNGRWRSSGEAVCSHCAKSFHRKPSHVEGVQAVFCSQACRLAAYPAKPERTCERCGKAFAIHASHASRRPGRFCSQACQGAAKKRTVVMKCLKCSVEYEVKRSDVLRGRGVGAFCSMNCKAAWMSGNPLSSGGVNRMTARKGGKRDDLEGRYFRSSWEANYARYLNWLMERGEVSAWLFEPDTFEFPVKRGSRFYTPDFKVTYPDGSTVYHEVKGYMGQQSATKLKRMKIYHPGIPVRLIDAKVYRQIANSVGAAIPNWEGTSRGRFA